MDFVNILVSKFGIYASYLKPFELRRRHIFAIVVQQAMGKIIVDEGVLEKSERIVGTQMGGEGPEPPAGHFAPPAIQPLHGPRGVESRGLFDGAGETEEIPHGTGLSEGHLGDFW